MPNAPPRPRARLAKLGLALAATAAALLVGEAALRIAGVSYPNFYRPDVRRGWALEPGAEGWWRKEGEAYVRINSGGLRDDEHPLRKAPRTLRIAVLGDSCTEALQVPVEQTFWKLLERELGHGPALAALGAPAVETLNFGVAGYGTAQELQTQRYEVWKYQPDFVLLAFYTGNDVRNNDRQLEQDPSRPYFVQGRGGGLELDDSFRRTLGYRLRLTAPVRLLYAVFNRVRLLQLAKQGKSTLDGWVGAAKARSKENGEALQELGLDNAVYVPPRGGDWDRAWRVTEAMILAMRDDAAAHRAGFGVVTLSNGIQVHPDPEVRRAFMRRLGLATLFFPDQRIAALGRASGIPVLNLAPPLQELASRQHLFLHGFANTRPGEGHWNARGHAAAAPLVAAWLGAELAHRSPVGSK
ncbi:MAG TPA: SGNH/GDSL hydrolase family protein [Thermoanaerobaculia bacterium]|nr:SGNH/GDSL hydrolase family protein [Thermoanaerobaculia bacterium]